MSSAWGLIGIEPVRFRLLASYPEEGAHLHDSWWAVSQQGRAALRSPLLCVFPRICRSCPHSLGRILTPPPAMPDSGGPGGIQLPCLVPQPRDSQIRIQDRWQGSSEPSLLRVWSPDRQHQPDLLKCTSSGHALVRLNQKLSNRGLTGHPHRSDAGSILHVPTLIPGKKKGSRLGLGYGFSNVSSFKLNKIKKSRSSFELATV